MVPRYRQTAVARNRVKRRLRELARLRLLPALAARAGAGGAPADVVIRAVPAAYAASFAQLAADLERVIRQLERAELPTMPAPAPLPPRRGAGKGDAPEGGT